MADRAKKKNPRASIEQALASVATRDAKLFVSEDGIWLVLKSRSGKSAMICLSKDDYSETVNTVIEEIAAELRAENNARLKSQNN